MAENETELEMARDKFVEKSWSQIAATLNKLIEGMGYCRLSYLNFRSITSGFAPKMLYSLIQNETKIIV